MKYVARNSAIVVSMERGDNLIDCLLTVAKDMNLKAASFSGIGAVEKITLGGYDLSKKEYYQREFPETYELTSCQGNIVLKDEEPIIHCHCTISGHDFITYSGHLFNATIAAVGEFMIYPIEGEIQRTLDKDIGLATWDLD